MVGATKRDLVVIPDLAPDCAGLGKAEMVGVGGRSSADQARLTGDEPEVAAVAFAPCLAERQGWLVLLGGL